MTVRSITFNQAPDAGQTVSFDGQVYSLVSAEPYQRKDGTSSNLLYWETACADCGAPFRIVTGMAGKLDIRRCPDHRQPLKRVRPC